jgi:hypothetical protein
MKDATEHRRRLAGLGNGNLLWQREHIAIFDKDGDLIDPVPDPHPQYFHVINDTAWMGMEKNGGVDISPGDIIAPFDLNLFSDYQLVTNLTNGTVTVPLSADGGYYLGIYYTFQAVSNGGAFLFELLADGIGTGFANIADLSNQSDIGGGTITAFLPIDSSGGSVVLSMRLSAGSSKDVQMLGMVWTMTRLFPSTAAVGGSQIGTITLPTALTVPFQTPTFNLVEEDTPISVNTLADAAIPTNWVTYQTITIDPALDQAVYEVLSTVRWTMSVANRAAIFRMVVNGVAQPTFEIEASSTGNRENLVSVAYFTSDGSTPHVILLQGLVRGPGAGPILTILSTRTRTFVEDSV